MAEEEPLLLADLTCLAGTDVRIEVRAIGCATWCWTWETLYADTVRHLTWH